MSCQKNVMANFDIHIENSDKYDDRHHDLYKLEIYKDNKIFKILEPEEFAPSLYPNIKLDSLNEGKYTFVYENIFGENIKKEIEVVESITYRVSITPDYLLKKNKKSVFENLKNSEAKLVFQSIGCFHQDKDSIMIINKDNNYFLRRKNGSLKPIDKAAWAYFVKTENKIREIPKNGGCTTRDEYIFYHKGKSDTIHDGTCEFSIWYTLKDYLKKNKLQ
ncbi:hypothetical protein [Chryseobacterium sp. IT-36CA2]|uniref:hypothetical protein n=1 Tax=Chryseobacterium sp. IT-36CA2 TaxID=3026460 RepID=UPI0039E13149